ncbi:MAG: hypothetical protein JNL11_02620 [Bdellovibrionaceae bacterium]|nr:hypothetical protein [Pseudobdellovibrionaceae bacterium]
MKVMLIVGIVVCSYLVNAADHTGWVLTTNQYKDVKVNGVPLKKAHFWEFLNWAQVETKNTEAMIFLPGQYYLKLYKQTHVRWGDSGLILLSGQVYIKNPMGELNFQVPGFFNFKVITSDMVVGFDIGSKRAEFEILARSQNIQIDSDDREIPAPAGTRLIFKPEFVDGEMAYDFLLNNRKIPKLHMEKSQVENVKPLELDQWKAPLKVASAAKNKTEKKVKAGAARYICMQPSAALNACVFVKEASACVRYTCNLNGQWAQRTPFDKNEFCPSTRTVKDCEWLGH